ncbi:hypothetical protein DYB30_002015 [Aphanomyces astaci]|uniref:HECT-type E3 ubiquitin transferase n=1 Tax=Aphanomyces astaci TaxID=112090 RepID=A0A397CNW4_APHAT|nr:hypothetical protein DYB30_002015 [Aphanomyces astaci]
MLFFAFCVIARLNPRRQATMDEELSRLLGLLSDRTALTGDYAPHEPLSKVAIPTKDGSGCGDTSGTSPDTITSQSILSPMDAPIRTSWYPNCPEVDEIPHFRRFISQVASEREWEHARRAQFVKSRAASPPEESSPTTSTTTPDTSTLHTRTSNTFLHLDDISPREWPHIPGKDVSSWDKVVSDVDIESVQLSCVSRLLQLTPGILRYEPIDVPRFLQDITAFLRDRGIYEGYVGLQNHLPTLPSVMVMLTLGIQLQSASILQDVAFLLLDSRDQVASVFPLPFQDQRLLQAAMTLLSHFPTADTCATRLALPVSRCLIGSWVLNAQALSHRDAIATDGLFLYIFNRAGLFKVGTGAGETVRNMVYLHNRSYCRGGDVERSWLCVAGQSLYCRTIAMPGHSVDRISLDLETVTPLFLAGGGARGSTSEGVSSTSIYAMISDGKSLYAVACRGIPTSGDVKPPAPPTLHRSKTKRKERAAALAVVSALEANPIHVGDRVVRGPDWKWSNQDGEPPGSAGTVERISTWGGVQGSGITVRWDKNQRMNTYRWGAEGCFDIQIVHEDASGHIVSHKPIKTDSSRASAALRSTATLHEFVVYRYDPSTLETHLDLAEVCMREMLQIPSAKTDDVVVEPAVAHGLWTTSSTHPHAVAQSDSTTPWLCDGHQLGCMGPTGVRYRCLNGCDFDLCAKCLEATAKDIMTPDDGNEEGGVLLDLLPFAQEDDAYFKTESKPTTATTDVDPQAALVELQRAWQGQFGAKECAVALMKHGHNGGLANEWLVTCGASVLKRRCVMPVQERIVLEQNNLTFLDPVLLLAASFYTTGTQLGVVIPAGICHVEPPANPRHGDVLNVFSMVSGSLLSDVVHPSVTVPGGSPMCYDHVRDRLIGYAVHAAVVLEFTNMEHASPITSTTKEPAANDPGAAVLYHLARIAGLRHRLPPTYFPRKAIQMHIQSLLGRGPFKKRQLKKLQARYDMMAPDPPQGYALPFCPDVTCLANLAKYIVQAVTLRWPPDVVNQWLYLLVGFLEEAMSADIHWFFGSSFNVDPLEDVLVRVGRGDCGPEYVAVTSRLAQRALLWGLIHQVFFASSAKLQQLASMCASSDLSQDNAAFMLLMPLSHPSRTYPNVSAAKAGFTGSLLRTFSSSVIFVKRLVDAPQVWMDEVLALTKKEQEGMELDPHRLSPAKRLLFSTTAYLLQHPEHPQMSYVVEKCVTECKLQLRGDDRQFQTSMAGVIMPLIVSGLANQPTTLAVSLLPVLTDLLLAMDALVSTLPTCQAAERAYAATELSAFLTPPEAVESPHPYGLGVPTFRKQVQVPNATALTFDFDRASCTINASDFLIVTSNLHTNLDRLSVERPFQGDAYLYGPSPWPSLSLNGDTAMMVLCATTHAQVDSSAHDKLRYGVKGQVRGYVGMTMPAILRVQHGLAYLCSTVAQSLLTTESTTHISPQHMDLLATWNSVPDDVAAMATNPDHPFVQRLEKQFGRLFLRQSDAWRQSTLACVAVCAAVARVDIHAAVLDVAAVRPIVQHVTDLQRFMLKHAQIEKEWEVFVTEGTPRDGVMERLAGNEELVQGLCSYLNITTDPPTPESICATLDQVRETAATSDGVWPEGATSNAGAGAKHEHATVFYRCFAARDDETAHENDSRHLRALHHKVILAMELCTLDASPPYLSFDRALLPHVVRLILQTPPTWTDSLSVFFPKQLAHDAFTRHMHQYADMLWMVFRRVLLKSAGIVPLTTRLESCHELFEVATSAHDKARILHLVHDIIEPNSMVLPPNWAATVANAIDFSHAPPLVLRAARRLLHRLAPPQDPALVRRILHGIGMCLSVEPPPAHQPHSDDDDGLFGTVLYWGSNAPTDSLMKLVNVLDTQLEPEIPMWNVSIDSTSLAKQQLMLDTSIVHRYVQCDGCGINPLVGHRFKCQSCSNYDLCTACYVANVHEMDHMFLRCSDASGGGDPLPPRFVVLRLSSKAECIAMAETITSSSLGLTCSVVDVQHIRRLQALVPEKAAASLRNTVAATVNASMEHCKLDTYAIKQELASEFVDLVRRWLLPASRAFDVVVTCLKLVPGFSKGSARPLYDGMGAVAVLGGLVEPLRVGGFVCWNDAKAQVRAIFPHVVHVQVASTGRVELNVKKADVVPVSATDVSADCAKQLVEVLYVFDDILQEIDVWLKCDDVSTFKADMCWRVLKAVQVLVPLWPSVSDNQVLAMYGCIPQTLMLLAQKGPVGMPSTSNELARALEMTWMYLRKLHHFVAVSPATTQVPIPNPLNDDASLEADDKNSAPTYWYNMYAYSTLADLPQHPGRNKLLDHWERHVIPAIQKYVRGSFKSYEMDYFFAQLREPLREGNNAAARRIAHTLCDGHVPPGCLFPENDTDWSALQWDDVAIGSTYFIELDVAAAVPAMAWCHGHMGTVALVDPSSKLALMQVVHPDTATLQHWWLPVSQLQAGDAVVPSVSKFTDKVVGGMREAASRAVFKMARACVFAMVAKSPDFVKVDMVPRSSVGFALSDLLLVAGDDWSPLAKDKAHHPIQQAIHFHESATTTTSSSTPLTHAVPKLKRKKNKELAAFADDVVAAAVPNHVKKRMAAHVSTALTKAMDHHRCFVLTSPSPPSPLVRLHVPDVSWLVLTFFVHPVLMDLPAGSSMEIFSDVECTHLIRGYYGGRKGLSKLPPVWVPANTCYIKMAAAEFARYKVRVDGVHGALGVATWLNEWLNDPHQWCMFLELGRWPPLVQQVAFGALIPKMPRSFSSALATKLADQWKVVYAEERPVFSTYAQQLVEMMAVVLPPSDPHTATPADVVQSFRRMTKFADAFADEATSGKKDGGVVGRVPVDEISAVFKRLHSEDVYTRRLLILQKLPRTMDIDGLVQAVSKWVVHLSLECCGEADDQSERMFSATDVTRFGILARVLYCPTDATGYSRGYCVVDVGRDDMIDKLKSSITHTPFYFEGDHTDDDPSLMAFVNQTASQSSRDTPDLQPTPMWACASCTFENSADAASCNLCGTPHPNTTQGGPPSGADAGWTCAACTYLNGWTTPTCSVCGTECDQEPPLPAPTTPPPPPPSSIILQDGKAAAAESPPSDLNQHHLSVLTFNDAYAAGDCRDPRVNHILDALVPQAKAIELTGESDLPTCPRERYMALRSRGFDLQLTRSSFTSVQHAVAAMAKWTFAMDVHLIEAALGQCHRLGLPNLTQMSVSHVQSIVDSSQQELSALSLPEIRLRFSILQEWNVLLADTLSLVDFNHGGVGAKLMRLRKLIFPGVKIRFFNLVQDNTAAGDKKPTVTLDRLQWKRNPTVSLFALVQRQLMAANPLSLRAKRPLGASDPFIAFAVVFTGENVVGEGGPYRQLFSDMAHECLRLNVFQPTPNAMLKLGECRDMVLPRPSATSRLELDQYEFVGLLMGCCLRTGVHLPLRVAPVIWKLLVHQQVGMADLKLIDQASHDSLVSIQTDPTMLLESLTFTTVTSDGTVVEVAPNGQSKAVTKV